MIGPYRLEELLGRGGMGEVHRAADTRKNGRLVALKLLKREVADPVYEERFRREAEAAARLRNPHVIPIHDYGEVDGRLFLEMALVEGADLSAEIARHGPLSPSRAVRLVGQVASALDAAHRERLVHRDVKPSNIVLLDAQGAGHPDDEMYSYLVDFGIARSITESSLTATGMTVGTATYMAPERFTHPAESDHRVDVYALGCVLYEALTGARPFAARDFGALMHAHMKEPVPAASRERPGLPAGLDAVIARAMAKNPAERFSSAGELAAAARDALAKDATAPVAPMPVPPRPPPAPPPPPRPAPPPPPAPEPVARALTGSPRDDRCQYLDDHGTVVRWLVAPGATVHPGTKLADAQSRGGPADLVSASAGVVDALLTAPGEAFGPDRDLIALSRHRLPHSRTASATRVLLAVLIGLIVIGALVGVFG